MKETVSVNEMSRGSMPMVRALSKAWGVCLVSAVAISFEASRNIRRTVDSAPKMVSADSVAIVMVVVKVEITYVTDPCRWVLY